MDIKSAAQVIRDTVETEQIISLYGYKTRHGFMVCPFHADKDASLKVYKGTGGWHCYGCGKGGSVIDFVMEHEGCSFPIAIRAIDNALHMNLFQANENPYEAETNRRIQECLDDFTTAVYSYCDAMQKCIEIQLRTDLEKMKRIRDKAVQNRTAAECTFLLIWEDESQYNEYKLERLREFREEVAAWRRKARRAGSA